MKSHLTPFVMIFAVAAILILAATAPAAAATTSFHDQQPFSIFVPCANGGLGENVDGIVKIHQVLGFTDDGAGGTHFHIEANVQGVGIGSVTGESYRFRFNGSQDENATAGGAQSFEETIRNVVSSMDSDTTFTMTIVAKFTVNANGDVVVDRGAPTVTCDGTPL
jgi:hypothetical protein